MLAKMYRYYRAYHSWLITMRIMYSLPHGLSVLILASLAGTLTVTENAQIMQILCIDLECSTLLGQGEHGQNLLIWLHIIFSAHDYILHDCALIQEGVTPLVHAMRRCDLEMVKVLIEGGADVGAQNEVNYKYHNTKVCSLNLSLRKFAIYNSHNTMRTSQSFQYQLHVTWWYLSLPCSEES